MDRTVLIVANPVSGHGKGEARAQALRHELQALGVPAEVRLTTKERTGCHLAREIDPAATRAIAVVGGDGSVGDVIRGLPSPDVPVAQLPAGTANVWAREARLPRSPAAAARVIARGRTVEAALGTASGTPLFLFVGAGIDARIVRRVEEVRRRRGHKGGMAQWWVPGWQEFLRRPLADLTVEVEARRLERLAFVLVTRVRSYAAWMRLPAGAIGDGLLHVLAFPQRSKLRLMALGARAVLGRLRPGRDVVHIATRGPVRIASAGVEEPYQRDGDHAGELPVEVGLAGRSARLIVP